MSEFVVVDVANIKVKAISNFNSHTKTQFITKNNNTLNESYYNSIISLVWQGNELILLV